MSKKTKVIELFTGQSFEESAVEMLARFEPGPVYLLSAETPEGSGLYICDEPFTLEEAEEQHMPNFSDEVDDLEDDDIPFEEELDLE